MEKERQDCKKAGCDGKIDLIKGVAVNAVFMDEIIKSLAYMCTTCKTLHWPDGTACKKVNE